ncbi:hypothetical protein D3C85_1218760 [compost metagenome]
MRCVITILSNASMIKVLDLYMNKIVLYATINYIITPHEPHYSANKLNQSIYDALLANDLNLVRSIMKEANRFNRERMVRSGRI